MNVSILYTEHMGRGVFAEEKISAGETILHEPSLYISAYESVMINDTSLGSYPFEFPDGSVRLVLGKASLINHSNTPNVTKIWSDDDWISIVALRDINEGEQLFHDYNFDKDKIPEWAK